MSKLIQTLLLTSLLLPYATWATSGFPTEATVRYVLFCMDELGGLQDENFYTCTCRHDAIAKRMSFADYEEGRTFERNKLMAGEKGGFFRDNKRGKEKFDQLVAVRKEAEKQCPIAKKIATPPKRSSQ